MFGASTNTNESLRLRNGKSNKTNCSIELAILPEHEHALERAEQFGLTWEFKVPAMAVEEFWTELDRSEEMITSEPIKRIGIKG